jgi:hypothetical protein
MTPPPLLFYRWSRAAEPAAPQRSAGGSSSGGGRTLSASDLAVFKIADLAEIGRKKGVTGGRDATRQSLTDALIKAGVSTSGEWRLTYTRGGGAYFGEVGYQRRWQHCWWLPALHVARRGGAWEGLRGGQSLG